MKLKIRSELFKEVLWAKIVSRSQTFKISWLQSRIKSRSKEEVKTLLDKRSLPCKHKLRFFKANCKLRGEVKDKMLKWLPSCKLKLRLLKLKEVDKYQSRTTRRLQILRLRLILLDSRFRSREVARTVLVKRLLLWKNRSRIYRSNWEHRVEVKDKMLRELPNLNKS